MHRGIHQTLRNTITRSLRSPTLARPLRHTFFAERLQDRLFVRLVFIARHQARRLVFQAFRRLAYQLLRVLFRAFAIDDLQYEFVFRIECDVIPVIAATSVSRIVFVAVFLFLLHEVPLLDELDFFGVGGKSPRVRRGVFRRVRLPV